MNHPPESSTPIDLTGRELGDYRIIRRLGRGGMADVYLANQNSLNRNVALKILKPELAKDATYVERFRREAQAAAGLRQGNIVQIYEVGSLEGFYFISQEYVQGRNLKQYLVRHGAVEPVMAINVLRQCAMALQEAGKQSVIHRDIKPENIMLSTNGEVKITDFGLARINNDSSKQALTQIGMTMGTPLYMSPEQVEGASVDQRSDIYSLGVTAYHMLAGHPPFDGDNALSIALKHVQNDAVLLTNLRPDVPDELCAVIKKMMNKNRGERHADAKSLLKDLRKVKVDFDDDWEMIVEKLSASETHSGFAASGAWTQSKLAATRQLQSVMKGNKQTWWKSVSTWVTVLTLSAAGLLGGMYYAYQTPPKSLLFVGEAPTIPKMESVDRQLNETLRVWKLDRQNYILANQKVIEYWPLPDESDGKYYETLLRHRKAKANCAVEYLSLEQYPKALEIFNEFVEYGEMDAEFQIAGYAGQAIVYEQTNDGTPEAREKIAKAINDIDLVDPTLNKLTDYPTIRDLYQQMLNRIYTLERDEELGAPKITE